MSRLGTVTERPSVKIGWACATWAFLGTALTLAVALQYQLGWWLAPFRALASGALVYLAYDWRGVGRAFRQAWRKTVGWRPVPSWRINLKIWHYVVWGPIFTLLVLCCLGFGFLSLLPNRRLSLLVALTIFSVVLVIFDVLGSAAALTTSSADEKQELLEVRDMFRKWNLISLLFWRLPRWLWRGTVWFVQMAPVFVGVILPTLCVLVLIAGGNFVWTFFRYLHSAERRICFTAVTLGVLTGFAFGYPHGWVLPGALVGGAAGGLLGILEYHVIAIRWLGIVPAKQHA